MDISDVDGDALAAAAARLSASLQSRATRQVPVAREWPIPRLKTPLWGAKL